MVIIVHGKIILSRLITLKLYLRYHLSTFKIIIHFIWYDYNVYNSTFKSYKCETLKSKILSLVRQVELS